MEINGYHGSGDGALHIGYCLTDREDTAEIYAGVNNSTTVYEVGISGNLKVAEVEYSYDDCEPVLTGVTADIAEYMDCDINGREHLTWMLLTDAAVAATTITGSYDTED